MPDKKISQLTALTTAAEADPLAIVNSGGAITKKITRADLLKVVNNLTSTSIINPLSAAQGKLLEDNKMDDLVDDTSPQLGGDLESNAFDIKMADDDKVIFGTGADGEIYVTADDLYIKNVTQDKDIIFGIDDGGVAKTITWDADVDKLKHSAGLFDFDDDDLTTTGKLGINTSTLSKHFNIEFDSSVLDAFRAKNNRTGFVSEFIFGTGTGANTTGFGFFNPLGSPNLRVLIGADVGGIAVATTTLPTGNDSAFGGGIRVDGYIAGTSALSTLAAGDPVPITTHVRRVAGSGGAVTLTSTPTLADGIDGQQIIIVGTNDTNTVTLQDEAQLANSGLQLAGGADFTLGQYDTIHLVYTSAEDKWMEISRSNN